MSALIHVQLCYCPHAGKPTLIEFHVSPTCSIEQFIAKLPVEMAAEIDIQLKRNAVWAVFGKKKTEAYCLRDGDRLELCAALIADPMSARRHRAKREHKSGKM
ncbi:RnfH family protein [Undibacterium fentianense]|uniref:RnfH family protein n=1 Tax=Undibacterium fentianense TaxID=2828728 RepID=A0A941DXJ2_9BURK|nr:RnfH family protein [Undibacterium fentianense]MBR7798620.1 RnfH family protein [Undibacterium fentianense]